MKSRLKWEEMETMETKEEFLVCSFVGVEVNTLDWFATAVPTPPLNAWDLTSDISKYIFPGYPHNNVHLRFKSKHQKRGKRREGGKGDA